MPKLKPKNWLEPMPPAKPVLDTDAVKAAIEALVTSPMEYGEIVDIIQADFIAANKHFRDAEILAIVEEVNIEWHPAVEGEPEGVPL